MLNNWILAMLCSSRVLAAVGVPCRSIEISFVNERHVAKEKHELCYDAKADMVLSPGCAKSGNCDIFARLAKSRVAASALYGPVGTPEIVLCHKIGGTPQFFSFVWDGKKRKTARCISSKDESFIDTYSMIRLHYAHYQAK